MAMVVLSSASHIRRKPVNQFLIHQSFVDCFACGVTIFEEVAVGLGTLAYPVVCHPFLTHMVSLYLYYISTYNMTCMTIDRHWAITRPLHYDPEKVRKVMPLILLAIWMFIILTLIAVPVSTIIVDGVCLTGWKIIFNEGVMLYNSIQSFILSLIIPVSIMMVCYARMYLALR